MQRIKRLDSNGFTHILLVCMVLIIIIIVAVGIRVHTVLNKSLDTEEATTSESTKKQTSPTTKINTVSPTTTVTPPPVVAPPPKQASSSSNVQLKPAQPFTTTIQIKGDAACRQDTMAALKLLHDKAAEHYAIVTKYIGTIECVSKGSGIYADENPPRYIVGDVTRNAGTVWYAGTIAHDAGHSKLYRDYLEEHINQSVPDDIWTGESAERACLGAQYDALSKIGGSQYQLSYVSDIINSQYYNVPYDQRWW